MNLAKVESQECVGIKSQNKKKKKSAILYLIRLVYNLDENLIFYNLFNDSNNTKYMLQNE